MFNSREYEWADIELVIGGKPITGIRGIKYTEKIEREVLYGKGRQPLSIQSGNIAYEGEITLTQSEADALIDAGRGTVLSLAADCVVQFGNPPNASRTVRIEGLRFTETPMDFKQGDKFAEITLPFIALNIKFNA